MDKLIELLGKLVQALLKAKTLWFIIVVVAVFSLTLLLIVDPTPVPCQTPTPKLVPSETPTPEPTASETATPVQPAPKSGFFGIDEFVQKNRDYIGLAVLASMSLIGVKVAAWLIDLLKDRFFV